MFHKRPRSQVNKRHQAKRFSNSAPGKPEDRRASWTLAQLSYGSASSAYKTDKPVNWEIGRATSTFAFFD
jgi:hypothetical protein